LFREFRLLVRAASVQREPPEHGLLKRLHLRNFLNLVKSNLPERSVIRARPTLSLAPLVAPGRFELVRDDQHQEERQHQRGHVRCRHAIHRHRGRVELPCQVSQITIMPMSILIVSSKGQIVLPASTRRRLGLGAGSTLEVLEDDAGVRLRVVRTVPKTGLTGLAGMVKVPSRGVPRRLKDFDPASRDRVCNLRSAAGETRSGPGARAEG
jgi:AbrB family looped-hinge helix DNA binding protein